MGHLRLRASYVRDVASRFGAKLCHSSRRRAFCSILVRLLIDCYVVDAPILDFHAWCDRLTFTPRLHNFGDQTRPAGLMGSANAAAVVPMEILVKINVVTKMWIALQPVVLAKDRSVAL